MSRVAGVLMPITSLPSPYGIGTIGKEARKFADFLKESGQKIWQILPVGPTSFGDSPYQPFSAFAGNPYFISPEKLIEDGLLTKMASNASFLTRALEALLEIQSAQSAKDCMASFILERSKAI